MMRLLVASLIILPTFTVSANADDGDPLSLLLWAATDPKEACQVDKIDPSKFFLFTEKYHDELIKLHFSYNFIGATIFLRAHADESGTKGVFWTPVFTKLVEKALTGQTEDKEHGLPSLIVWASRNTGTGTILPSVDRRTLVNFLFSHKKEILKYQHDGDVDGLINFLDSTKAESTSNDVDWKSVINGLKDNRRLFKYSCGLLNLQLCDYTNNDFIQLL